MNENGFSVSAETTSSLNWFLDLTTAQNAELPFITIHPQKVECRYLNTNYIVEADKGSFSLPDDVVFRITPDNNIIALNFSRSGSSK